MCESCGDQGDPPPSSGITRRKLMAMGASLSAGIALGLWSCRRDTAPTTKPIASTSASKPSCTSQAAEDKAPASTALTKEAPKETTKAATKEATQSAPASQATMTANTTSATRTQTLATPDLGNEMFPDENGRPLAQPDEVPVILVPRMQWTVARPRFSQIALMGGVERITVHHTAGEFFTDGWTDTARHLEAIRLFHSGTRGTDRNWADIAYHFAVDRAGRVWQARPLAYQGAHARQHNEHNLGIALLGNFEIQSPTAAQLVALGLFIEFVRKVYSVPLGQVYSHGELVSTSCPGKLLQGYLDRHRTEAAAQEGVRWLPAKLPTTDADAGPGSA